MLLTQVPVGAGHPMEGCAAAAGLRGGQTGSCAATAPAPATATAAVPRTPAKGLDGLYSVMQSIEVRGWRATMRTTWQGQPARCFVFERCACTHACAHTNPHCTRMHARAHAQHPRAHTHMHTHPTRSPGWAAARAWRASTAASPSRACAASLTACATTAALTPAARSWTWAPAWAGAHCAHGRVRGHVQVARTCACAARCFSLRVAPTPPCTPLLLRPFCCCSRCCCCCFPHPLLLLPHPTRRPLLHALMEPCVRAAFGIELDEVKVRGAGGRVGRPGWAGQWGCQMPWRLAR